MPQGKGTYGTQVGRPRKRIIKSTVKRGNKRNDLKIKTKFNKDGTVKKTVTKFRGKRRVVKPKRDERKSILNTLRNRRDEKRDKERGYSIKGGKQNTYKQSTQEFKRNQLVKSLFKK